MNSGNGGGSGSGSGSTGIKSPFTLSQWQELEHQALIFKYMMAALPVPPDLLHPIQKSFESISHRFLHHPTMGYCSFYGKKVDPEPGRCRRTDGKKWRCSKDAYPDSKYCERHMHRGRNRSRKPVESQTQSLSTEASLTVTGTTGETRTFQNLPLNSFGNTQGTASGTSQSHYQIDSIPYGIPNKGYSYVQGLKPEVGQQGFFSNASGDNRGLQLDSSLDNTWPLIQSKVESFPISKSDEHSILQNEYPQNSFFNSEFVSVESVRQEGQSLRPFFDEWPKSRDSWSGLEDERSNQRTFSTTQLSISIPMNSSDFSATISQSPQEN